MNDFEEYIRQGEPQKREKGYAWRTAIGLQAVDDLKPSEYLIQTARQHIEGDITIEEVKQFIDSYYQSKTVRTDIEDRTEEADKVSARIAEILSEKTFSFSPIEYIAIHRRLFQGIYKHTVCSAGVREVFVFFLFGKGVAVKPIHQFKVHAHAAKGVLRRVNVKIDHTGKDQRIAAIVQRQMGIFCWQNVKHTCRNAINAYSTSARVQIKLLGVSCLTDVAFYNKAIFHSFPLFKVILSLCLIKYGYRLPKHSALKADNPKYKNQMTIAMSVLGPYQRRIASKY